MCGSSWAQLVLWGRAVAMGSAGGAVPTAVVSCVWCWCVMQSCDVPAQRSPNRGAINSWVRSLGMGKPALCGWVLHWLLLC